MQKASNYRKMSLKVSNDNKVKYQKNFVKLCKAAHFYYAETREAIYLLRFHCLKIGESAMSLLVAKQQMEQER